MTKILLGAIAILVMMLGLTIYFGYGEIATLQQNNATLTAAVGTKDALIEKRDKAFREQTEQLSQLNIKNNEIITRNKDLEKLFSEHKFNKLLQAKPGLMGKKMTDATKKLGEEFEALTAPGSYNE